MTKKLNIRNWLAAIAILSVPALYGCEESMTEHEEHAEPEGVQISMGGRVVASYDGDTQQWTGELEVDAGEETPHITVTFVDHDGDAIPLEEELYLEVDVEDESIAEFEQDTPGEFGGHLHGVQEGETEVTFKLMHGAVGSGHPDFITTPVRVRVRGSQP